MVMTISITGFIANLFPQGLSSNNYTQGLFKYLCFMIFFQGGVSLVHVLVSDQLIWFKGL